MATDPQTLSIEPGKWGPEADHWLTGAAGADLLDIKSQLEHGAALFYVKHEGATVGAFVLRVDMLASGAEGVIVAASAKLAGVDMIETCMPAIESKFVGCKSIRYHTRHPALARKLARRGFVAREIVCSKAVQ